MPNLAATLKEEITRLARKEVRAQTGALKQTVTQYRKEIAKQKRVNTDLQKRISFLERKVINKPSFKADSSEVDKFRFGAKGFKTQRKRLGLTVAKCATLMGVSALSISNWEKGKTSPSKKYTPMIITMRGMGKREAQAQLEKIKK